MSQVYRPYKVRWIA